MSPQTVILRPNPFAGVSSTVVVLVTILIVLGIAAHAAVV